MSQKETHNTNETKNNANKVINYTTTLHETAKIRVVTVIILKNKPPILL